MTANTKTPVMVLQELTVKQGISPPEYTLVHSKSGTHENEFHYRVVVCGISEIGVGRSKQIAKHDTAKKALEKLAEMGIYHPQQNPVNLTPGVVEHNSPIKSAVNCIGTLNDLCMENKIPFPIFTEISDVGPPHCREFTYQCQIASITTRATAGTKKQSKQIAAKEMLERIKDVLPDLAQECKGHSNIGLAIEDTDAKAIQKYTELTAFNKSKPNLGVKIQDYALVFKNIIKEKEINCDDINKILDDSKSEEGLGMLLEKLEINYKIDLIQEYPEIILLLSCNTETPFSVMAMGENYDTTYQSVINKSLEFVKILLH